MKREVSQEPVVEAELAPPQRPLDKDCRVLKSVRGGEGEVK